MMQVAEIVARQKKMELHHFLNRLALVIAGKQGKAVSLQRLQFKLKELLTKRSITQLLDRGARASLLINLHKSLKKKRL